MHPVLGRKRRHTADSFTEDLLCTSNYSNCWRSVKKTKNKNKPKFHPCGGYQYLFNLCLNPNILVLDVIIDLTITKQPVLIIASYREME